MNDKNINKRNNVKAFIVPGDFTTGGYQEVVDKYINDWEIPLRNALYANGGDIYTGPGNHDNDTATIERVLDFTSADIVETPLYIAVGANNYKICKVFFGGCRYYKHMFFHAQNN